MTQSSTVFSRTCSLVFLCASLLGLSSTSLLCLALEASPPPCDPRRPVSSHHRSRSFLRSDSLVHVLLVPLWNLMHSLSVVIDLGFCGVSTTALRFSSDQRAYTTPSSVRTRCSSVRSLFPSHTPDFHLSAKKDFQILFPPLEDVQELFLQTPPFHDMALPWHDRMGTVSRHLGNEE